MTEQIFSVDCFIDLREDGEMQEDLFFNIFYIKIIMMALFPFLLLLSSYIVWYGIGCLRRDFSNIRSRVTSTIVILLFFVHPSIVSSMFSQFK